MNRLGGGKFSISLEEIRVCQKNLSTIQPSKKNELIPILSSATVESKMMGFVSKNAKPDGTQLKVFSAPSLIVARNGTYAGQLNYVDKGQFTITDHAYALKPKKSWRDKINLRGFMHRYQELLYNIVTTKSGNATFSKTYAKRQCIRTPDISVQNTIATKLSEIDDPLSKLERSKKQIA